MSNIQKQTIKDYLTTTDKLNIININDKITKENILLETPSGKGFLKSVLFDSLDEMSLELLRETVEESIPLLLKKPEIVLYGKIAHRQRNIGFFSDESVGYHYSGQLAKSQPLSFNQKKILKAMNNYFGTKYNGILINEYPDGTHTIGAHSDDESNLDQSGVIAVSYGAIRKFRIRDKNTKKIVADFPTIQGEILQMGGDFQKAFTHEIPKEMKVKENRVSLTFRRHLQ